MELIELSGWLDATVSENVPTVPERLRNWLKIEQHVIFCLSISTCWNLETLIFWPQIKTIINNDVCQCAIFRGFMLFCVISSFI